MTKNNIPKGWYAAGSNPGDYWMGVDPSVSGARGVSAALKSKVEEASGFGTLMQNILADEYRGERVRFSADLKGEEIEGWAGLWMRVDVQGRYVSFDNMQNRSVKGTMDWTQYDVVLDVPEESEQIAFGFLLGGIGQVWMNDLSFEIVGEDVPTTDLRESLPGQPVNLSFEESDT